MHSKVPIANRDQTVVNFATNSFTFQEKKPLSNILRSYVYGTIDFVLASS